MKYLIDTDWIADHLEDKPAAVALLTSLFNEGAGLSISLITYGEIYEGIIWSYRRSAQLEVAFVELLRWIKVLSLDEAIMRRFAAVRGSLRKRGQMIGDPDVLIAATALHLDLTLVTRNFDHFLRIPDLKLYEPS